MKFDIPGQAMLEIQTVILDLNGTLTIDGKLIEGIEERIKILQANGLEFRLFTGDTLGTGTSIAEKLGLKLHVTKDGKAKFEEGQSLKSGQFAVIGNGRIDLDLFRSAALRVTTLQEEGIYAPLLSETDVLVKSIRDALDLFIHPKRLIATLRR
jgi:soluble P-type ATPase